MENGCQEIGRWLRHDLFLSEPSSRALPPLPPVLRGAQEDPGVHPGHRHPLGAEAEAAVRYQWRILLLQATDAWSSQAKKVSHRLDVAQVWLLTQFFLFPFCKKSLISLEGKSMTPCRGNTILYSSSQLLPCLRLGPLKRLLS